MNYTLTKANISDHTDLTNLCRVSKAHWGYPSEWLILWEETLTVTKEHIQNHPYFKLIDLKSSKIIGFCGFEVQEKLIELDHLWLLPEYIGQGLGRYLLVEGLKQLKINPPQELIVIADPNAEAFYRKLSFKTFNYLDSQPEGRKLPKMKTTVEQLLGK